MPEKGIDSVYNMLCTTIIENGGFVSTDFDSIDGIAVEELKEDGPSTPSNGSSDLTNRMQTTGVLVKVDGKEQVLCPVKSVISSLGVFATYRNLISTEISSNGASKRTHFVPAVVDRKFEDVKAASPLVYCIYWLQPSGSKLWDSGSIDALECNYYESTSSADLEDTVEDSDLYQKGRCKVWCPSLRDRSYMPSASVLQHF